MATYSALPATLNLVATVGNDFTLSLTVTENGSPWVATGATLATDIIDSSGTVVATDFATAASTGSVTLSLTDTNTTTLGVGVYSYRLSVTKSSLTRDWIAGTLSIVEAGQGGSSTSSASLSISNSAVTLSLTSLVAPLAENISVADAGGYYTGDTVEEVLAEVGAATATLETSARLAPGLRWAFFGDSIVAGSSASNFFYSFAPQSLAMVGGTVARADSIEMGTSGDTSALLLTRVPTTLATYPTISGSVVMVGMNDSSTPVSTSTYASNLTSIVALLRQVGPVVLCTVTPRASTATAAQRNAITAYNVWIKTFGYSLGCEVADTYTAIADTTTGYLSASYDSGDGIHPNDLGHHLLAVEVAKAMKRASARTVANSLVTSVVETTALLTTDPLATNATNVRPSSWFEQPGGTGTAPTYTLVTDTSSTLPVGRWAQMDFDGTASGGLRRLAAGLNTNWSVGDVLALFCYVQVEDVSGSWRANVVSGTESVSPLIVNQSGVTISGGQPLIRCVGIPSTTAGTYDIGPIFWPFTVPSGTTSMSLWLSVTVPTGQRVKARFGNTGVINLTALGLDSSIGAWANTMTAA